MEITTYLDHDLKVYDRVREMAKLADQVAARPVAVVIEDLHGVLAERELSGQDHQLLHVLLSQLYHAGRGVTGDDVDELRAEVTKAWELSRSRAALHEMRRE